MKRQLNIQFPARRAGLFRKSSEASSSSSPQPSAIPNRNNKLLLSLCVIFASALRASAASDSDALSSLVQWYLEKADAFTPATYWTIVRIAATLLCQTSVCDVIFSHSHGKLDNGGLMALQWFACFVVVFFAAQIPVTEISLSPAPKGFILAASLFAVVVLPWRLSWLLVPQEGYRRILARILYAAVFLVIVIQLFRST